MWGSGVIESAVLCSAMLQLSERADQSHVFVASRATGDKNIAVNLTIGQWDNCGLAPRKMLINVAQVNEPLTENCKTKTRAYLKRPKIREATIKFKRSSLFYLIYVLIRVFLYMKDLIFVYFSYKHRCYFIYFIYIWFSVNYLLNRNWLSLKILAQLRNTILLKL